MACDYSTADPPAGTKNPVPAVTCWELLNPTLNWNHEHLRPVLHDCELHYHLPATHGPVRGDPLKPPPTNVTDLTPFRGRQTRCACGVFSEHQTTV